MTKQSNFDDVPFSKPGRAARTWLAQKALKGMKVVTPSLNWITLSSTFGHGVSVLASGRLPYLGYAPGNLPSWASRATSCLRSTSSLPQRASSTSSLWTTWNIPEQQCSMKIDLFPSSTFLNSVMQSNSEDVFLSMPGRTCQDVSVVICDWTRQSRGSRGM